MRGRAQGIRAPVYKGTCTKEGDNRNGILIMNREIDQIYKYIKGDGDKFLTVQIGSYLHEEKLKLTLWCVIRIKNQSDCTDGF